MDRKLTRLQNIMSFKEHIWIIDAGTLNRPVMKQSMITLILF